MANRHGLGNDACRPATLITPCPAAIDQFFEEQLHYMKLTPKQNSKANPFVVTYAKALNHADNPVFCELKNSVCMSYVVVDLFYGAVVDAYFEYRPQFGLDIGPVRSYAELPENNALIWVFKWHLNIVHMTREYLKGGWLYRSKRQRQLEATKDKYVILNKKGFTNILENAKPDNVVFLGNGKIK